MPQSNKSWYEVKAIANGNAEISIHDEIGAWGVSAKQFNKELAAVGKVNELHIHFNTPGGNVIDGMAIYNMLKAHPAKKLGYVDGIAASMGSFILMAMDEVHTPVNSLIMIHMPRGPAFGTADDLKKTVSLLEKLEGLMIGAFTERLGLSEEEVSALLKDETWYTGEEAVAAGLSNYLTDEVELKASFDLEKLNQFQGNIATKFNNATSKNASTEVDLKTSAVAEIHEKEITMSNPKDTPATDVVDTEALQTQAIADYKASQAKRKDGIKSLFASFKYSHGDLLASCLEDESCSKSDASAKLLDALGKDQAPQKGGYNVAAHAGNGDITKESMSAAIKAKAGLDLEDGELDNSNPYRGMTLTEIARASLADKGVGVASMGDRMSLVGSAFTHSSSDFTNVLADVANKSMLKGFEEANETFQLWTQKGQLSDFKISNRVALNDMSSLEKVNEGAEYKYGTVGDRGEKIALATYGKRFSITRQAIINDDLSAFTKIPRLMGLAAIRTIGDLVYAILTDNPKMSDNKALFHSDHNNLFAAGSALSVASLDAARTAMRKQKLTDGKALGIRPEYLLVPAALETTATKLMRDTVLPGASNGESNPVSGMAQVISEARLDEKSAIEWYLAAGSMYDTIEVAYLDGVETPFLDQMEGWSVDGTEFKVRMDAGVAPMEYRTLSKSTGAA